MMDDARSANGSAAVAAGSLILVALVGHPVADWLLSQQQHSWCLPHETSIRGR
jgi:hypothetical protein